MAVLQKMLTGVWCVMFLLMWTIGCGGPGQTGLLDEDGDGVPDVQDAFPPVRPDLIQPDAALGDHVEAVTGLALVEDHLTGADADRSAGIGDPGQLLGDQRGKQRALPQLAQVVRHDRTW